MEKNVKQKYIDILKKAKSKEPVVEAMEKFINSYDGTNEKEFTELVVSLLTLLVEFEDAKIKAEGYEKLHEIRGDFEKQMNVIKEEYKELEEGKIPLSPPSDVNLDQMPSKESE